jgi:intracellular sulfur oxidation DsrE/DsrF family protein
LARLKLLGLAFEACRNTMKAAGLKIDNLHQVLQLPKQGGVYRLAELQLTGYAYIRP